MTGLTEERQPAWWYWWHPGLWTVCRLQARALIRRLTRQLKTVRGVLLALVGGSLLLMWLGSAMMGAFFGQRVGKMDPVIALTWVPIGLVGYLCAIIVTSMGEHSLSFTPAESDILFRAPVTRRQLLIYKLARQLVALLFPAIFVTVGLGKLSHSFWQAYVAGWLMLVFLHLLAVLWAQGLQSVGMRLPGRVKLAIIAVMLAGVLGLTYWVMDQPMSRIVGWVTGSEELAKRAESGAGAAANTLNPQSPAELKSRILQRIMSVRYHPVVSAVMGPLEVFPRIMVERRPLYVALPAMAALGMCLGMIAVLVRLDADFLDKAEAVGRRRAQLQVAMRRSGGIKIKVTGSAKRQFAMPGFLMGAGPVAWRQINSAIRQSRGILISMAVLMVMVFVLGRNKAAQPLLGGVAGWGVFLLAGLLRFDFRADLDRMQVLKAWPVSPLMMTVGQLFTPVVLACGVLLSLAAALMLYGTLSPLGALGGAVIVTAAVGNMVALENAVFLLFPSRGVGGAGDLQNIGRNALMMIGRLIVLGLGFGAAVGVFIGLKYLTGSKVIGAVGGGVVVWGELILMLLVVAYAFKRFDPGSDVPPA